MSASSSSLNRVFFVAGYSESLIGFRGAIINDFLRAGLEVHAAAPALSPGSPAHCRLSEWGVICHDISLERTGVNPFSDLRAFLALYFLMRRVSADIVFCYTVKPVIYGTLAAWLAKVPHRFALITGLGYAFTGNSSGKRKFVQRFVRLLYSVSMSKVQKVFFQNPDDEALFVELGLLANRVPSVVVNGSGVDLSEFQVRSVSYSPFTFLLIARLLGDKGVREFVSAAHSIKEIYPGAIFRIVGSVDSNPDSVSEEEVYAWRKDGVVEFLGRLDDVRPAIECCSVYVLPSYREGTPRTVLEAMAMGRAIITTDAPGCRETVIDGENGFLVPVKSVDALVEAMTRFIEDPDLAVRMGKRSREIAEEKYDVHKVNAVMLKEMGIQ